MRLNMKKTITFSVLIITTLSIISKLLGFLRETVVAYYFGTTHEADIFFLVFGLFTFITSESWTCILTRRYSKQSFEDGLF